jgi:hypothetical protein
MHVHLQEVLGKYQFSRLTLFVKPYIVQQLTIILGMASKLIRDGYT